MLPPNHPAFSVSPLLTDRWSCSLGPHAVAPISYSSFSICATWPNGDSLLFETKYQAALPLHPTLFLHCHIHDLPQSWRCPNRLRADTVTSIMIYKNYLK